MNFGDALKALKDGKYVYRVGWSDKNAWLKLQVPDAHSKMTLPYIYTQTDWHFVPWLASQLDLLAEDWVVSEIEPLPR